MLLVLSQCHLMFEIYLLVFLHLSFAYACNMRIQVLSLRELLAAVPAGIALTVYFRHMFSELGLLLEINSGWRALLAGKTTLMRPLYMFSLLVSIRESLKAPMTFQVWAFQELSVLISSVYRGLMPGQMLPSLVVLPA